MKKSYALYALLLLASCTAPAGEEGDKTSGKKVYVINNGTWGDSNSDIAVYDLKGKSALAGQFLSLKQISEPTRPRLISVAVFCL